MTITPESAAVDPFKCLCELTDRALTPEQRIRQALEVGRAYLGVTHGVLTYTGDGQYEEVVTNSGASTDASGATDANATVETDDNDTEANATDDSDNATDNTDADDNTDIPLEHTWCRHVVERRQPVGFADAEDSPYSDDIARDATGTDCYVGAPIIVNGETFGTLSFSNVPPKSAPITQRERDFVAVLANWVSYELERQYHYTTLEKQNKRLEEFARIIAHDLRNPLAGALGFTEIAQETATDEQAEYLSYVKESLDRMEALISDCLLLAKEGADIGEREKLELATIARDAWGAVDTQDATLSVETDRTVFANGTQLRRLFEHLFENAVKHGGPAVTVTVGPHPEGFEVTNDGRPLSPEVQAALEAADTENITAFGFGLVVVKRIVSGHGWGLRADSSADTTTFTVTGIDITDPIHRESLSP